MLYHKVRVNIMTDTRNVHQSSSESD